MTITKQERQLLTNILNSLDRLFDRENQIVDVHDLLLASSVALIETIHSPQLQDAIERTQTVLRSGKALENKRDDALTETQTLREYLAIHLHR